MTIRRIYCMVIVLSLSLVIFGCSGGDDDDLPTSPGGGTITPTESTVDTTGGLFMFVDSTVWLDFPVNAVDSAVEVTVAVQDSFPYDTGYVKGSCFEFSPDGISFNSPVTLTIYYSEDSLSPGVIESNLGLYTINGENWQVVSGFAVHTDSNFVRASINGFSSYGIIGTVTGGASEYDGDYYITDSASLADFQQYTSITGKLEIRSDAPDTVELPNLVSVGATLHFYGPAAIEHRVVSISLPALETVGSSLLIENCDSLRSISMPLCGSAGSVGIMKNKVLPNINGIDNISSLNPTGGQYLGNIQIYENDSLTDFNSLASIVGTVTSVTIRDNPSLTSIAGISGITRINSGFELRRCNMLSNLSNLALNYCGRHCIISENAILSSLEGLQSLQTVAMNLQIEYNGSLPDLAGLGSLTSVGGLFIEHNSILSSLNGLGNISFLSNTLSLQYNPILADISDLSSLMTVTYSVRISYSDSLTTLNGLNNLTAIGDNLELRYLTHLQNLDALTQLNSAYGHLVITNCFRLTSLTGLYNVQSDPGSGYVHESLTITENSHAGTPSSSLGNQTAWDYVTHIGGESKIEYTITIDGN